MSIIEMSVTGGIMILAVIVMHALGVNKLPKRAFIVMWEIVLLRLLLPVSIPLPILPAVEVPSITAPSVQRSDHTAPSVFIPSYDINVPEDYIPEQAAPVLPPQSHSVTEPSAQIQPTAPISAPKLHISLGTVYAVGASALALFFVLSYVHSIKKFRASLPVEGDYVSDWLYVRKGGRRISVRYSDRITSPLTYGILKPVILLPKDTDISNQKLLSYILEHEYAHIRHLDALKKLICTAALCLHWFNPLVWAMYMLYNRDMELWCDECVIRRFGETSRANYARMLITMEELKSGTPLMSYFRKNSVEERIVSIMKYKKKTVVSVIAAVLLVAAVTVTIIATSVEPVPKKAKVDDSEQLSSTADDSSNDISDNSQIVNTAKDTSNVKVYSFPINVFIDSETSQKYYSVYDKYAIAIAPEDEEMFASSEYSMTSEELYEWTHREFGRIIGLTEGKMFYDSAANLLIKYDVIGKESDADTLNYREAENLTIRAGGFSNNYANPVNLVFTERYVTPADESDYEEAVEFPITVYVNTYTGDRYYSYYDRFAVYTGKENEYMFTMDSCMMTAAGFEAWIQSEFDRILNLTEGEMYYNTDTNRLFEYDGITFGNTGVCDTLNYHMCESLAAYAGMITNSFEKPVKMVFTEWLTNPVSAVSWSISYGQPATGDFSGIKNYFDYIKKRWVKDEVPIIEDPELYAAATSISVETDVIGSQINDNVYIYPSISAVAGDEHGLVVIIEVDTRDLVLPEDMPENAVLQFMGATDNFYAPGLWHPLDFVSQNGTVYSYAYSCFAIDRGLPNQVNIELRNFGYYDGEEFVPLIMGTYSLIIDSKKFNTTEKLKKISKPVEVRGVKLELELTPFGLVVKSSNSQMKKRGLWDDKYFLSQGDCFDFYLRDGSVIGEEEDFFDTAFYGLLCKINGWVDFDNDISYDHYGFMVPVDVEEIEAITVHGVRFDIDYAE